MGRGVLLCCTRWRHCRGCQAGSEVGGRFGWRRSSPPSLIHPRVGHLRSTRD